jgi:hypothetical protein
MKGSKSRQLAATIHKLSCDLETAVFFFIFYFFFIFLTDYFIHGSCYIPIPLQLVMFGTVEADLFEFRVLSLQRTSGTSLTGEPA